MSPVIETNPRRDVSFTPRLKKPGAEAEGRFAVSAALFDVDEEYTSERIPCGIVVVTGGATVGDPHETRGARTLAHRRHRLHHQWRYYSIVRNDDRPIRTG
jgi:hypothetical protein